jgi:hypothetical protein
MRRLRWKVWQKISPWIVDPGEIAKFILDAWMGVEFGMADQGGIYHLT